MVDQCIGTAAFCLCAALLAVLLRQHCREQSMLLALGACGAVVAGAVGIFAPLVADIREIFADAGLSESYLTLIFKAAAISLITQMTCELCRDCGETAIGSAAEMWGKGCLAMISIPLIRAVMEQINVSIQR